MIYKRECCGGGKFEDPNDWTDDDAIREFKRGFPMARIENAAVICDDCYNQMMSNITMLTCCTCGKTYPAYSGMLLTRSRHEL